MKIIKKLLPILCLCIALTACGTGQRADEKAPQITLGDLVAANTTESVLKGHCTKLVNTIYYKEDGSADFSTYEGISIGKEGYETTYENSYGYTEFQKGGRMYIFDPEDNKFSIRLFIDHQIEAYIGDLEAKDLNVWGDEKMVENSIENGVGTMITEVPISSQDVYLGSYFDAGKYDVMRFVYTYNPETLELQKYSEIAYGEEAELILTESFITYTEEGLEVPEFVTNLENDKATYNVTLHRENGKVNKYTVSKEAVFQVFPPEGYALYKEAEGKTMITVADMVAQDTDIYILPEQ